MGKEIWCHNSNPSERVVVLKIKMHDVLVSSVGSGKQRCINEAYFDTHYSRESIAEGE